MLPVPLRALVPESFKLRLRARRALRSGERELALVPILSDPDGTSVDVGANVGVYAWHIARASARAVVIEPNPALAERLRRGLPFGTTVLACALSDREGETDLAIPLTGQGDLASRATIEPGVNREFAMRRLPVPLRTLDGLDLERVGFLKVHAEGHEHPILAGGRQTIARDLPTILVGSEERHVPGARCRIEALLMAMGYRGFFIHGGRLHDLQAFREELHQNPDRAKRVGMGYSDDYTHNFIFIHPRRSRTLEALTRRLGGVVGPAEFARTA